MFQRGKCGWLIWNTIVGALLAAFGIAACVNAGVEGFQSVIILIVAIFVIADAGLRLLLDVVRVFRIGRATIIKTDYGAIGLASIELSAGVALIGLSNAIREGGGSFRELFVFLGNFVGTALIVVGGVSLILAIIYIVKKLNSLFRNIGAIIGAAVAITLGILALIYCRDQENFMKVFFIGFGLILALSGIIFIVLSFTIFFKKRQLVKGKKKEEKPVEPAEEPVIEEPKAEEKPEEEPEEPKEEEPEKPEEKPEE